MQVVAMALLMFALATCAVVASALWLLGALSSVAAFVANLLWRGLR